MPQDWTSLPRPARPRGQSGPSRALAAPRLPKRKVPPADGEFVAEIELAEERHRLAERNRPTGDGKVLAWDIDEHGARVEVRADPKDVEHGWIRGHEPLGRDPH